jgi:hypothetical protein
MEESSEHQITRLAEFIMKNIPDEPSQDEGAVDCAIRLLRDVYVAKMVAKVPAGTYRKGDVYEVKDETLVKKG